MFPFCLDRVGHGNIQRILAIGRYLASTGLVVDIVYQGRPRVAKVEAQYSAFRRVVAADVGPPGSKAKEGADELAAFYGGLELPLQHMRPSARFATLVRSLIDAEPYTAVISTYAFTAPIFAGLTRRVLMVCDVQDVIHEHADESQRATGQPGDFTIAEATEVFLWRQWDVLVAITPKDEARIRRDILPHQHLMSAGHAVPCASDAAPGMDDVAFYAGSRNESNVQAVTWCIQRVWPLVHRARPASQLRLAGLICAALPEALRQTPGVELLGFQSDVSGELARCGVLVAPYLYGSGLKIKVVEAACAGKAILTTSAGLAGTGLEPGRAIEAHDDPERLAEALAGLLGDRPRREALGEHALARASEHFTEEACYAPIKFAIQARGT